MNVPGICSGATADDTGAKRSTDAAIWTIAREVPSLEHGCGTVHDASGATVRLPGALARSRQLGWSSEDAHRWLASGGAQIGTVRVIMSMTIMGAPQCRQMKTGRLGMTASSCDEPGSCGTPSSVRAFARFARRTVGKQPVVADAVEAGRQHVEQEAAHEFAGIERHDLV
ncbi:hypothetical protein K788_0004748 [Paraburkholderia caribensis MBA4]|uniref:Uncharacterized protein n=1 Tax=Paraburkholderia caribensis MBA4 TaxID=1323664 RepID=A0A0P0RJR4_9BURK|nr:hypothetical protein K788_0004748 [Paraburkholderia caribensis MBA4]